MCYKSFYGILLTMLMSVGAVSGFAAIPDDGDHLYVYKNEADDAKVYSLDNLDKITFTSTGVRVWSANESEEFTYEDFRLMMFREKETPTGIGLPPLQLPLRGESSVYDVQGRKLNALQRGVNIIRMTDGTVKKVIIK